MSYAYGRTGDQVAAIAVAIVGVALVTTIVSHKESANIINAIGSTFADVLRAAMGTKK